MRYRVCVKFNVVLASNSNGAATQFVQPARTEPCPVEQTSEASLPEHQFTAALLDVQVHREPKSALQRAGSSPQLTSAGPGGGPTRTGTAGVHFASTTASAEQPALHSNDRRLGNDGYEMRDVQTRRQDT